MGGLLQIKDKALAANSLRRMLRAGVVIVFIVLVLLIIITTAASLFSEEGFDLTLFISLLGLCIIAWITRCMLFRQIVWVELKDKTVRFQTVGKEHFEINNGFPLRYKVNRNRYTFLIGGKWYSSCCSIDVLIDQVKELEKLGYFIYIE